MSRSATSSGPMRQKRSPPRSSRPSGRSRRAMPDSTREATEATLLRFLAAFKAHDQNAIANLVSPDCVVDSMVAAGLSGRDGIRQLYAEWFQGFPDLAVHAQETLI